MAGVVLLGGIGAYGATRRNQQPIGALARCESSLVGKNQTTQRCSVLVVGGGIVGSAATCEISKGLKGTDSTIVSWRPK